MGEQEADVVIVGAGVAGLALAAQLGRAGHAVLLIDKAAAPRDKVCGEGVMPLGIRLLEQMGLGIHGLPGADFTALDYRTRRQAHTLHLRAGLAGRGLRRTALIAHLQQQALGHPSVRLAHDAILAPEWEGGHVTAVRGGHTRYRGRVVVAADGVNSALARRCGAAPWVYGERMGVRRHYRVPAGRIPPRVQVGLFGRHDVYLTPVGRDEWLATTMTDRGGYRDIVERYDDFLCSTPYGAWFADATPVSDVLGWHHPLFRPADYAPGGAWLVGDASGGIDPCLGMGISMALAGARQAAGLLSHALNGGCHLAHARREYATWRNGMFLHYHDFGRLFRSLVATRAGSAALVRAMQWLPAVADRLFGSVAEMRPWPAGIWKTPEDSPLWRPADETAAYFRHGGGSQGATE